MATLSFRKLGIDASFPTSGMTEGTIYFCPKEHTIGIATGASTVEKYYGGNVKDAKYANNKLTITYNDGTTAPAVLDFSDMASAKGVAAELNKLKALHAPNGDGYKTVDDEITDKLSGLNSTKVENTSGYISAVSQSNGVVSATAKAFDATIPASDPSASNAPTTKAVKDYVDGKVSDTKTSLNYTDTPAENQYVSAVNQSNGVISVTRKALPTLNTAIDKTGTTTDGNAPTSGAVKTYVTDRVSEAIRGLDFTDNVDGEYVTTINETDGVFTIEKGAFETSIAADSKSTKAPTSEAVATFVKSQLSSLSNVLHFKGAYLDSQIQDGLGGNLKNGDVVIATDTQKEYVYYYDETQGSGRWVELGDEGHAAALIDALDVTDNPNPGEYVSAVSQTDGKIKVTRATLPTPTYNGTIAAADDVTDSNAPTSGAVKTYVSTEIGKLNVLEVNGGSDGYIVSVKQQDGKVEATSRKFITNLSADLGVLVEGNAPTSKAVKTYVSTEIGKLDYTDNVTGSFVTTVNQTDGTVSITKGAFDSAIPSKAPSTSTAPTTAAVKSYVDTEVSKAVGGALTWASWE